MQGNFNNGLTIADFQQHLENTQQLLVETSALSEQERAELQTRLAKLKDTIKDLEENSGRIGMMDSIYYNLGWDWQNTALNKVKGITVTLQHLMPQLTELHEKMTAAAAKYAEMQQSVTFLARNFQGLIDSNKLLMHKVDNLDGKVVEQSQKMNEQSQKMNEQSQKIDGLTEQNKEQSKKIDALTEQMQILIKLQMGNQQSVQQATSFVSYI